MATDPNLDNNNPTRKDDDHAQDGSDHGQHSRTDDGRGDLGAGSGRPAQDADGSTDSAGSSEHDHDDHDGIIGRGATSGGAAAGRDHGVAHPAIAELTEDGDTFDLSDYCRHCGEPYDPLRGLTMGGECMADPRTLRLRIEPDQDHRIMDGDDGDWFGNLAWVEEDRDTGQDKPRPDGFDGRARKLGITQNHDAVWWQPPADVDDEHLDQLQRSIGDLLDYGYCGLIVELLDGEDAYHRPIVVNTASLWGIEPFPDREYVAEVVGELVAEVLS